MPGQVNLIGRTAKPLPRGYSRGGRGSDGDSVAGTLYGFGALAQGFAAFPRAFNERERWEQEFTQRDEHFTKEMAQRGREHEAEVESDYREFQETLAENKRVDKRETYANKSVRDYYEGQHPDTKAKAQFDAFVKLQERGDTRTNERLGLEPSASLHDQETTRRRTMYQNTALLDAVRSRKAIEKVAGKTRQGVENVADAVSIPKDPAQAGRDQLKADQPWWDRLGTAVMENIRGLPMDKRTAADRSASAAEQASEAKGPVRARDILDDTNTLGVGEVIPGLDPFDTTDKRWTQKYFQEQVLGDSPTKGTRFEGWPAAAIALELTRAAAAKDLRESTELFMSNGLGRFNQYLTSMRSAMEGKGSPGEWATKAMQANDQVVARTELFDNARSVATSYNEFLTGATKGGGFPSMMDFSVKFADENNHEINSEFILTKAIEHMPGSDQLKAFFREPEQTLLDETFKMGVGPGLLSLGLITDGFKKSLLLKADEHAKRAGRHSPRGSNVQYDRQMAISNAYMEAAKPLATAFERIRQKIGSDQFLKEDFNLAAFATLISRGFSAHAEDGGRPIQQGEDPIRIEDAKDISMGRLYGLPGEGRALSMRATEQGFIADPDLLKPVTGLKDNNFATTLLDYYLGTNPEGELYEQFYGPKDQIDVTSLGFEKEMPDMTSRQMLTQVFGVPNLFGPTLKDNDPFQIELAKLHLKRVRAQEDEFQRMEDMKAHMVLPGGRALDEKAAGVKRAASIKGVAERPDPPKPQTGSAGGGAKPQGGTA